MKRKILVIGAGGIGSFLIPLLDKVELYDITVADPDKVETKNLPYQNFGSGHVSLNKAVVMKDTYYGSVSNASQYPVLSEKQMKGYDLVICCVDNIGLRRTMYNCKDLKWLDLRAQGRNAAMVSYTADPKMYDTLLAGEERSFSCQGDSWDGSNKGVHFMQVAIAGMGAQWIQRWFNDEEVCDFKVVNV
tara:strand:+ start:1022 stop:1588 length:567 start_codon:yes stop_codon:yes gene_type:complete